MCPGHIHSMCKMGPCRLTVNRGATAYGGAGRRCCPGSQPSSMTDLTSLSPRFPTFHLGIILIPIPLIGYKRCTRECLHTLLTVIMAVPGVFRVPSTPGAHGFKEL